MKADKNEITKLLRTAKGQLEGIMKMIEDDRYCIDISTQLLAVSAVIKKANNKILKAHMQCCLKEAMISNQEDEKIEEIMNLISKINS